MVIEAIIWAVLLSGAWFGFDVFKCEKHNRITMIISLFISIFCIIYLVFRIVGYFVNIMIIFH
jgi:uncharacterized membrane protein (DUF2068 family)